MTLPAVPTIAQILAEISQTFPYTFPDNRTRWLADLGANAPLVFPSSFANKQSVKVVASVADAGGSSPHTFSGVNFGLDFPDRMLVACTCLLGNNAVAMPIFSVTIGGVTASGVDHGEFLASGPAIGAGVFGAAVPTGISGNVTVAWAGQSANASGIILLSVSGTSGAAFFTGGAVGSGSGDTSSIANFSVPNNGILVIASAHSNANATGFSGVTDRATLMVGTGRLEVGFDNRLAAASGAPVTASWAGNAARGYAGASYAQA